MTRPKHAWKRKPTQINEKNVISSKRIGYPSIWLSSLYRDPNVKKKAERGLKGGQVSYTMSLSLLGGQVSNTMSLPLFGWQFVFDDKA